MTLSEGINICLKYNHIMVYSNNSQLVVSKVEKLGMFHTLFGANSLNSCREISDLTYLVNNMTCSAMMKQLEI